MAKKQQKLDADSPFGRAITEKDRKKAIVIARNDPKVPRLKLPSPSGYERALHAAVRIKSAELAEVLLGLGSKVDMPDGKGYTALFLAPELYAPVEVVKVLVEHGANIHVDNDAPLWSAIWQVSYGFGGMPIVRYLVDRGSHPRGLTHAAETGNLRVVPLLLKLGANVNELDDHGKIPLDYATGAAHTFMESHVKKKSGNLPSVEAFLRERGGKLSAEL
ncbi:MAG: hypothetical protein CMO80_17650 [Verrucomicrobiales bacterium]|nr:hypothetical protein [Verrucomicrobiales bacterium]|tara:strand:+ start:13884 stop:14540 length:657 start_codon:yes stop_codon:yes gene_type:complete